MDRVQLSTHPLDARAGEMDPSRPPGCDLPIGVHRGALAGLSEEDRARELEQHRGHDEKGSSDQGREPFRPAYGCRTAYHAIKEDPPTDLEGYLLSTTKSELNAIASRVGIERPGKMLKVDLARELSAVLPAHVEVLEQMLVACDDGQYETFRMLLDTPGATISYRDVKRGECPNIAPLPPFTRLFKRGRDFDAGMPPQVVAMARNLDMAAIDGARRRGARIVHAAQVMTDLAGAVELAEVAACCDELFGFCPGSDEVEDALIEAYRDCCRSVSYVPLGAWRDGGAKLLLATGLAAGDGWRACDGDSIRRIWALMPWMTEAGRMEDRPDGCPTSRDSDVRALRLMSDRAYWNRFEKLKIDSRLAEMGVIDWERSLPEIVGLRNWLDAHVPDLADDYRFADAAVDDLLRRRSVRVDFAVFAGWARELGLFRLAPDAEEFCSLLARALCALPSWRYGGRSAHAVGRLLSAARAEQGEKRREADGAALAAVA